MHGAMSESKAAWVVSSWSEALAQVSAAIAAAEANIHNLVMRIVSPDFHKNIFELEVRDLVQLTEVLSALKLTHGLSQVRRATVADPVPSRACWCGWRW